MWCLIFSSYQMLHCGRKDSSASCWKLSQSKETEQVKHLQITNYCFHISFVYWVLAGILINTQTATKQVANMKVVSLAPPVLMEALPFLPSCWSFRVSYTIWITGILKAWGWQVLHYNFVLQSMLYFESEWLSSTYSCFTATSFCSLKKQRMTCKYV